MRVVLMERPTQDGVDLSRRILAASTVPRIKTAVSTHQIRAAVASRLLPRIVMVTVRRMLAAAVSALPTTDPGAVMVALAEAAAGRRSV